MQTQTLRRKEEKCMKKFVALALAVLLVCTVFAGCGKSDTPSDNTGKVPPTPDTPAPDTPAPVAPDQGGDTPKDPDPGAAGKPNATPSDIPTAPATPSDVPTDPVTPPEPSTPPAPVDPTPSAYERGEFDWQKWESKWADMQFVAPSGYEIDEGFLGQADPENGYNEMQAIAVDGSGGSVQVRVYKAADGQTADGYIDEGSLKYSDSVELSEIGDITIAGRDFRYVTTCSPWGDIFTYGVFAAAEKDGYFIDLRIGTRSEKTANMLLGQFARLSDGLTFDGQVSFPTPAAPPADPETPPAADTDSYVPGYVDGNYWGSEWLGVEATFGGGYAMSTQQELIEATLIGSGVLFDSMSDSEKAALAAKAATSYEMMAKDDYGNNVNVTVEKLPFPMNVLDYIDVLKQQLALTNGNPQFGAEPQGVEFCSQTWVVYEWTLDVMGYTVAQAGLFRLIDDRMAIIVFTMVDEYALGEMVSMFDVFDGVPNDVYTADSGLPAAGTLENGVWAAPQWGISYTVGAELSAMAGKELYDLIGYGQNETAFDLLVADAELNTLLVYSQFNYPGYPSAFYIDNVLMADAAQTDYVTPVEGSRKSVTVCGVEFESVGFEVREGKESYLDYYYAASIEDRLVFINVSAQTEDAVQALMAGFGN